MYGSGHRPHTSGLSPSRPPIGANTLTLRRSSSTSDTYTNPMTLAARTVSAGSLLAACITANVQCCISDDGSSRTSISGPCASSESAASGFVSSTASSASPKPDWKRVPGESGKRGGRTVSHLVNDQAVEIDLLDLRAKCPLRVAEEILLDYLFADVLGKGLVSLDHAV